MGVWQQCVEFYWKILEQERKAGSELLGSLGTWLDHPGPKSF